MSWSAGTRLVDTVSPFARWREVARLPTTQDTKRHAAPPHSQSTYANEWGTHVNWGTRQSVRRMGHRRVSADPKCMLRALHERDNRLGVGREFVREVRGFVDDR
jgi:hypothetical protein